MVLYMCCVNAVFQLKYGKSCPRWLGVERTAAAQVQMAAEGRTWLGANQEVDMVQDWGGARTHQRRGVCHLSVRAPAAKAPISFTSPTWRWCTASAATSLSGRTRPLLTCEQVLLHGPHPSCGYVGHAHWGIVSQARPFPNALHAGGKKGSGQTQ